MNLLGRDPNGAGGGASHAKRRSGHIINMGSIAAWIAAPMYSMYSASKYGVLGFSDGLRRDLLPFGVKVSVICPGPAKSEFGLHTGITPSALQTSLKRIFPSMTSETVAERVLQVAKRPRRYMIFPWYYPIAIWIDFNAPWLVDWFVVEFQTRRDSQAGGPMTSAPARKTPCCARSGRPGRRCHQPRPDSHVSNRSKISPDGAAGSAAGFTERVSL